MDDFPMTTVTLDLNRKGLLLDAEGKAVQPAAVPAFLKRRIAIPAGTTDINVFAHGWMTSKTSAEQSAQRLLRDINGLYAASPERYQQLRPYRSYNIVIRWPSKGRYRKIRDRAHRMSTEGSAAAVIAQLLGYLNTQRHKPYRGPAKLRTSQGQYLHAIGHSFGGRFLCQAIQEAGAGLVRPPTLAWDWTKKDFPFTVDSVLILQMASPPDVFAKGFNRLLTAAPINCPILLTYSKADHATGIWHRIAEFSPGIGHVGARVPADEIVVRRLRPVAEDYTRDELKHRIVNINASARFKRGRFWLPQGAHSDFAHPETAHLLLSLAALAR
jgi:esterase/lipase superfamily enzyme